MKRPAFQFYPADWRKDMALQSCSVASRGLWIDMLCIAHECDPYGHLTVNGRPMTNAQIGRHTGLTERECSKMIDELGASGVLSRTDEGAVFSRRMVRDEDIRQRRAEGGKAGSEHGSKGAEHGHKGGRPVVSRGVSKPPLHQPKEPPPSSSSSSSSSTSVDSPIPPRGPGRPSAIDLKAWLDGCKVSGEKPIPEDDPVFAYAEDVGISAEFLRIAWQEFRHRYNQPDAKKYRDWRAVFRKAVRGNWMKVWYLDAQANTYGLTTVGHQAQRANNDRKSA